MPWKRFLLEGDATELGATAPSNVLVQTAAAGSAPTGSRTDHKHSVTTGTAATVQVQANAPGTATSLSRSDHKHNVSTAAPAEIQVRTATAGTATSLARSDHIHNVSTATAASSVVGQSSSAGSSTALSRADHRHAMPSTMTPAAHASTHASGGSDILYLNQQDINNTLSLKLNQIAKVRLETLATAPSTATARVFYHSGGKHVYVWVPA